MAQEDVRRHSNLKSATDNFFMLCKHTALYNCLSAFKGAVHPPPPPKYKFTFSFLLVVLFNHLDCSGMSCQVLKHSLKYNGTTLALGLAMKALKKYI